MTEPQAASIGPQGGLPAELAGDEFEQVADQIRPGQVRALVWALCLNGALLIIELAGALVFGSLALLPMPPTWSPTWPGWTSPLVP